MTGPCPITLRPPVRLRPSPSRPTAESILFVKADSPLSGDTDSSRLALVDVATGSPRRLTSGLAEESAPLISPDGAHIAYTFPRDGQTRNEDTQYVVPIAGGNGIDVAHALDRSISGAAWMPDSESLVLAGNNETHGALWLQPIGGKATRIDVGALNASAGINVGKDGAIAFTATDNSHAAELYYIAHVGDAPVELTHLQTVTDGVALARPETVHWQSDSFDVDGVLTYPPDYTVGQEVSAGALHSRRSFVCFAGDILHAGADLCRAGMACA